MFVRAACTMLATIVVATTAPLGAQTEEMQVVETEDSFTIGDCILVPKRTMGTDPVARLFHGFISLEEALSIKEKVRNSSLRLNLELAYARLLVNVGCAEEALRILDENEPWEGNEQKYPWVTQRRLLTREEERVMGHNPDPDFYDDQWFQAQYLQHYTQLPNRLADLAKILRAQALMVLGRVDDACGILDEALAGWNREKMVEVDAIDDKFLEFFENGRDAEFLRGMKVHMMFRSSIARVLGMPNRLDRPWRDAILLRAKCFAIKQDLTQACEHFEWWLTSYGKFHSYEDQIDVSLTRLQYLVRLGRQNEIIRERERGLKLCAEYDKYLDRPIKYYPPVIPFSPEAKAVVTFEIGSLLGISRFDPRKLVQEAKAYVVKMTDNFKKSALK